MLLSCCIVVVVLMDNEAIALLQTKCSIRSIVMLEVCGVPSTYPHQLVVNEKKTNEFKEAVLDEAFLKYDKSINQPVVRVAFD